MSIIQIDVNRNSNVLIGEARDHEFDYSVSLAPSQQKKGIENNATLMFRTTLRRLWLWCDCTEREASDL